PQEPEPNVSDDRSSEYSTCQSNDSVGSIGTSSGHFVDLESEISSIPPEVYVSTLMKITKKGVSVPKSKEVEPSCVSHIKTPRQPLKDKETHKVNRKNWNDLMERELGEGYSFTRKKCFVWGSLNHLIKDCDYYEQKMAREAEVKRAVNTGNRVAKPVWTNANRINHDNQFVPRSVQINAGRPKFNSVRPNINTGRTNISSGRPKVNSVSPKVNTVRPRQTVPNKTSNGMSPKRPQMNQSNQRRDFSKLYSSVRRPFAKTTAQMSHFNAVVGNWGSGVKTSASYNWRNTRPNFNYNSGPTFIRIVNAKGPQGRPKPAKAWVTRINWRILKRFGEEPQTKTPKRLKDDEDVEAKDDEPTKKSGKRRKQMARKGLNTSVDKDDSEGSDEDSEEDDSVTGTKSPINPVPIAMKTPSIATYKIIKQGEKGAYQIVREDGTDIVYINFGAMLKEISRDDLTELYRIVMNRYGMDGLEIFKEYV
ncbi:hypothetical protein Tco_1536408, partial [Tanacetum coccineum]